MIRSCVNCNKEMLRKLKTLPRDVIKLRNIINKAFKRKKKRKETPLQPSPTHSPAQPELPLAKMSSSCDRRFLFPQTSSTILPDPSAFFSPALLSSPLPTNSFFQNFVLKNGDQPEYIHPYLIKSSSSSVSMCYPSRFATAAFIYQTFVPDLTISSPSSVNNQGKHIVSSFNDLSVTLDLPPSLRFFLVRGSPFVTASTIAGTTPAPLTISSIHAFLSVQPNSTFTKHTFQLNSGQTYLCYSSSPLRFEISGTTQLIATGGFNGVIRIAFLPDSSYEFVLDQYSSCYPVAGDAKFSRPGCLEYRWEKKGWGDLLLLAHPLHLRLLDTDLSVVLDDFKYRSIDGDLVGVVGDSWLLQTDPVATTWCSKNGLIDEGVEEIVSALSKDVSALTTSPIQTTSSYFYGKAIARAARLALIAYEASFSDVIPTILQFLRSSITPWLDGSFNGNGFLYESKWKGIVTKQGSTDSGADFGFGVFNDHHYHLGYFLYAIAVLAKFDPAWGRKFKPQAYTIMADFMNLSRRPGSNYARLRCFDLWKLHSWAGGLTEFADGRNQESTSEAVNAYYSAALMGLSYGDTHLLAVGSTLTAFEIAAAETWWHVREGEGMYEDDFSRENRVVGVLWANKRDSGLWFAPPEWRECRMGIQVLPLLPITEDLFRDLGFVKELVKWTLPALAREGVADGWKGFVYAMEGVYDKEDALVKLKSLSGFDDGNSLSNLLWWVYSRGEEEGGVRGAWFGHYCH